MFGYKQMWHTLEVKAEGSELETLAEYKETQTNFEKTGAGGGNARPGTKYLKQLKGCVGEEENEQEIIEEKSLKRMDLNILFYSLQSVKGNNCLHYFE